jgi:hypothetical protein
LLGYEPDHLAQLPVLAKSSANCFAFFAGMMALQLFLSFVVFRLMYPKSKKSTLEKLQQKLSID